MKKRSQWRPIIPLLIIALLTLFIVFLPSGGDHFNSAEWKNADKGTGSLVSNVRLGMVNDLIKNHLHKGLKRNEVLLMLGRPNTEDGTGSHGTIDIYWLTHPRSLWQDLLTWFRFQSKEPVLVLEYGTEEEKLIDIRIK